MPTTPPDTVSMFVNSLAVLLCGFSLFSAITLALAHFSAEHYRAQALSRAVGLAVLLALAGLQLAHYVWLQFDLDWVSTAAYRVLLFTVAPAFFLFARPLLEPNAAHPVGPWLLFHAVPIATGPWLPAGLALPAAFLVGIVYLAWLARCLYRLRLQRANFERELLLLGAVFVVAVGASLLGVAQQSLPDKLFYSLYAIAIGLAFMLVQAALALRPQLAEEVRETAQVAYASSTLNNVDCDAALARLDALMRDEGIYVDATLSLAALAERLGLGSHQLSELINTRLGKGFSRYLREQRVAAAKAMLCREPAASVLSVGLNVGFTAQSNFYEAFREIEGMTPGQYRKLHTNGRKAP